MTTFVMVSLWVTYLFKKPAVLLARACFCSKNTALNNIARTAILFVFYVNIQEELIVCNVETVQP